MEDLRKLLHSLLIPSGHRDLVMWNTADTTGYGSEKIAQLNLCDTVKFEVSIIAPHSPKIVGILLFFNVTHMDNICRKFVQLYKAYVL